MDSPLIGKAKSISKNGKFNDALQSESVFLYFTQLGKCMYTLEDIDFEELLNSQNMNYDIDHIYPQSLLKDDSFNNKVLVKKGKNNEKSDKFIFELHNFLDPNKNFKQFYEMLVDKELISKEKKNRLLKKEITDIELEGFVNRQLVSTSQSVKGLITILKLFKNVNPTHIIMSKAENISDFRHEYNLIKSRTANNYHHAHDAYLNVVVGKALNKYFSLHNLINAHDFIKLRQEESDENGKKEKIVLNVKKILNINRYFKGNIIWNKDLELGKPITFKTYETKSNKTYEEKVYNNGKIYHDLYERFDVNETTMTYNKNELLAKVTILPKNNGIVPIKSTTLRGNIAEYGGITSGSYSKFTLIKIVDKKNNEKIMLYPILTMNLNNIDNVIDKSKISKYEILVDNVKINDLIISGNTKAYISGAGDGGKALLLRNATDRNFDFRAIRLIRMLDSYFENKKNNRNVVVDYDNNKIIVSGSNRGYDRIMTFNEVDELYYSIVDIYSNKSFNYSQTKSIINSQELYSKLNIDEKLYFINQALFYLKTNERKTIDLKLIGGSTNSCMLKTTIGLKSGDKIIRKSYTGYYQTCLYEVK